MKHKISIILKIAVIVFVILTGIIAIVKYVGRTHPAMFNPHGVIAIAQRNLIITAVGIMLLVAIPTLTLTFFVAWKYRAGQTDARYAPNWDHNIEIDFVRWAIPLLTIVILSGLTWKTSHALDPFKPIDAPAKPITIEVIALNWKWLFVYPAQNLATVNYVEFPSNTPVEFDLTSDAPMNSFWIPQLGGQMYAMAGMKTKLNLMADTTGEFAGSAAEINGKGFADMQFTAKSVSQSEFSAWVFSIHAHSPSLTAAGYDQLAKPSVNNPQTSYSSAPPNLFDSVILKFMEHAH